jgi:hypothetical protein
MMKTTKMKSWMSVLMVMSVLWSSAAAENLGDMLREAGWNKIIGTWMDADTKGEKITVRYGWKYKDHVIQVTSTMGELKSTSLIGRNGKTGEIFQAGANSTGGASLGKWSEEGGDAVLEVGYVSPEGEEGGMQIRHHMQDDDTMVVTVSGEGGQKMTITLVRKKAEKKPKKEKKADK